MLEHGHVPRASPAFALIALIPPCQGSTFNACQSGVDCLPSYKFCVNHRCMNLEDSTGLQGWVVATLILGLILSICTLLGCLCFHPGCSTSRRFAHPRDPRMFPPLEPPDTQGCPDSDPDALVRKVKFRSMSNTSRNSGTNRIVPTINHEDEVTRF
eukprot:maker-scaffold870_size86522-snap-gene-0.19 protein:Tk03339 transcript:maker-scaffold870_size86522-snap-gene-0.19-mRNA-1 annotation:"---NA---"